MRDIRRANREGADEAVFVDADATAAILSHEFAPESIVACQTRRK